MVNAPYPHGAFCWTDLATPDLARARAFYTALFGWRYWDVMGESGEIRTIAALPAGDICSLHLQTPARAAAHLPTSWMPFVAVNGVEQAVAMAVRGGGTILAITREEVALGPTAILADPFGAAFAVRLNDHAPGSAAAAGLLPGTVCWYELATVDPDAAARFYQPLFGWGMRTELTAGVESVEWLLDHQPVGGAMAVSADSGPVSPHWLSYVSVAHCDRAATIAVAAGGSVCKAPFDVPQVGRAAVLSDPAGATFAVIALSEAS